MRQLILETNGQFQPSNDVLKWGNVSISFSPPLREDYWIHRVQLWQDQAIVAFPKHGSIGIGFAQEEYYNVNYPVRLDATEIFNHIKCNKKYDEIPDWECIEAIRLIQEEVNRT